MIKLLRIQIRASIENASTRTLASTYLQCQSLSVWPDGLIMCSIYGYLQQLAFAHKHKWFDKSGSKCCHSINGKRFIKFRQSGHILPNLVTLVSFHSSIKMMFAQRDVDDVVVVVGGPSNTIILIFWVWNWMSTEQTLPQLRSKL